MNIEDFENDDLQEWDESDSAYYASSKPSPMKFRREKPLTSWQKIEQLKDEAMANKLIVDEFAHYDM